MALSFYIIILTILLIGIIFNLYLKPRKEHFLTNTVELSDLTLRPLTFSFHSAVSRDFLEALSQYIPLVSAKSEDLSQFRVIPKSQAVYDYFNNGAKNLRLVTNIYKVYFTMITNKDSRVYTYDDLLKTPGLTFYYLEPEDKRLMETLFPGLPIKYTREIPNKLPPYDVYCFWDNEYSKMLNILAKNNKFLIINMPKTGDIYTTIQLDYPNLVPQKYDISLQYSINTERVIYSLSDTVSIFTTASETTDRVYSLIKTIFENIESIRNFVKDDRSKFVLEYFRPENLIEIALVPYHPGVVKYFWQLEIYTYKPGEICVNTISTIPCQPQTLFDNRFRMILYGSNG